ncbi:MAG TPA: hypothetical protein VFF52_28660 [Isosphaeraceae bacterium]|jgi:hypothetical protein|nr:hypothetical protein [Isosphaeraceae bacterium]
MPVHIEDLHAIPRVTVQRQPRVVEQTGPGRATVGAALTGAVEDLTPLATVLPGPAGHPESGRAVGQTSRPVEQVSAQPPLTIDPLALADRVYRLMRDELLIARERE